MAAETRKPAKERTTADGRRRLIAAAITLSARKRSFAAVGLRELAREARLNPNTFYRHFESLDDLGLAAIEEAGLDLRAALREVRQGSLQAKEHTRRQLARFFDFVRSREAAFMFTSRELQGASPAIREALRKQMRHIADEIAADIHERGLIPTLSESTIGELCLLMSQQMLQFALDYIETPSAKNTILAAAERYILAMFLGTAALQAQKSPTSGVAGSRSARSAPR
jgi:AcrR family transcriptional regulator